MNKSAIKGFSIRARRKLIEDITQKAYSLGILDTGKYEEIEEFEGGFKVKNTTSQLVYSKELKSHRDKLITEVNKKGFEQVIEEVAYTWFNRIIAIRFMEINEYLPVKIRMLSSEIEGKIEPDVLTNIYDYVDELKLDSDKVFNLKETHKYEELFKYIFVKECNNLGQLMPQVFEKIGDFTELLLPDQLLSSGSIIRDLVDSIEEENFEEEVEIIGWMYQYYISEKKDEVFAALKKNKKITKENIPAATQLFTPKWIVKYMTENSLGRLWQESHPDEALKKNWEYYIEPAEQEVEVQKKLEGLKNPNLSPEDITILDPAMGSGHILVYAFDLLYVIYLSRGYAERDIPKLILEKNLYGLDIDDRAAQLATFALLMKARSKNRKFFKNNIDLNICSIHESNAICEDAINLLVNMKENEETIKIKKEIRYLVSVFKDAKEYGSILNVESIDLLYISNILKSLEFKHVLTLFDSQNRDILLEIIPKLIKQAEIMCQKFDVVCTNPPYMGIRSMNDKLANYLRKNFNNSKNDISIVFMESSLEYLKPCGLLSMINIPSWMFLSSYNLFRKELIYENVFESLIHLGRGIFGSDFGTVTFTIKKYSNLNYLGRYKKLFSKLSNVESVNKLQQKFFQNNDDYSVKQEKFIKIDGCPIAYWISERVTEIFDEGQKLCEISEPRQGMATSDNNRFLRYWFEVKREKIGFNFKDRDSAKDSLLKWFPYNKGGGYRKWYGNNEYVINWENDGFEVKAFRDYKNSTLSSNMGVAGLPYVFQSNITWSKVTIGEFSVRYLPEGYLFDVSGCSIYGDKNTNKKLLGLLNSKVMTSLVRGISPTVNYEVGTIKKLPVLGIESFDESIVDECIKIEKKDWDYFETSWEFKSHPLLIFKDNKSTIENSFGRWMDETLTNLKSLKKYEEIINENYIRIYGLENELAPDVIESSLTIYSANKEKDIKSLISYGIGCLLKRYSLNDQEFSNEAFFEDNKFLRYNQSDDNILLISENDYFENDLVHRFVEFLKVSFSEETLEENLKYIAEVLNPKAKGTARQTIRTYFVKDFYKDHLKTYKKRPIYWMIDSGKQNGVKALFYLHRYDKSTIARFRTEYLHKIQSYYENDIELTSNSTDAKDKKKVDVLKKKLIEVTEFDKLVAHIANKQIEMDLDDGVEHNYELFQGVEVPQGDGQKPIKANLLAKRK